MNAATLKIEQLEKKKRGEWWWGGGEISDLDSREDEIHNYW